MIRHAKYSDRATAEMAGTFQPVDGLGQIPAGFSDWNPNLGSGVT